jgi:glycosyltransferase involved in cell wall biosynthesis
MISEYKLHFVTFKPHVIHAHFGPNGSFIYNQIRRYQRKVPILTSFHGTDFFLKLNEDEKYRKQIVRMVRDSNCYFTVPSKFMLHEFQKNLNPKADRLFVLPNTYKCVFANNRKKKFYKKGDDLKVLNVGRLVGFKGHKFLIEGFAMFNKSFPNSYLTIVGDGPLKKELERLVIDLNCQENIKLLGAVDHERISDIYLDNDIYIQSSIQDSKTNQVETFGVSLLEAIVSGLYVIGTRSGGIPEVIHRETYSSIIVDPNSSEQIAEALLKMSIQESFSLNLEYVNEVTFKFSNSNLIDSYNSILQSISHK